jgi:hypothetical protein
MKTLLIAWTFAAILVGFSGLLRNTNLPLPALCVAITLGLIAFLAIRRDWRERALALGIRALLAVHLARFFGFYFLWLWRQGLVADDVAMLAGWGPIIVAIGAVVILIAFRPDVALGRQALVVWNTIGLVDVLLTFAVMTQMARPDPLLQGGFASLPLSLLPTLLLPMIIVSHVLIYIWWFRRRQGSAAFEDDLAVEDREIDAAGEQS